MVSESVRLRNMKGYLALAFILVAVALTIFIGQDTTTVPSTPAAMCEVGSMNPDGSVSYTQNHAGQKELLILNTTSGVKILAECN